MKQGENFLIARSLTASLALLWLIIGITLISGCAKSTEDSVIKECILADDQLGTLSGKWRSTPIPLAFHQGDFNSTEIAIMIQAINTWNDFYSQSLGLLAIDYGDPSNPRTSTTPRPTGTSLCSGSLVQGANYLGPIMIYKNMTWPFPDQSAVMALTSFCRTTASPLPFFYMQVIDLNYQNFFSAGRKQPDLQTIILHELGHMLGLNHSCNGTAATGIPGCSDPRISPDYVTALMYPTFTFDRSGRGQIKRNLNSNDQGRANCLYMNSNSE